MVSQVQRLSAGVLVLVFGVALAAAEGLSGEPAGEKSVSAESPVSSPLKIDIKIGADVRDREVVGEGESFPSSQSQVVGWTRVQGASEPVELKHVWLSGGKEQAIVPLLVKSSSYRMWSRKTLNGQAGKWTLQVRNAGNDVLASKDFEITAAP